MFTALKTATLSAMIALGALAAVPATAQADSLYLDAGGRHGPSVGWEFGDGGRDYWRHDRRSFRGCSYDRALDKADRMGLRRARVVDEGRRTISVAGRKWDRRVVVTFARAPGCPVIGR